MAHNKASLLGLPLELRWEILFLVLLDNSRPAPPGPSKERFKDRRSIDRPVQRHWSEAYAQQRQDEARRVRFEAKPYPNPVLSLLLSNEQLHYETFEVLRSKRFVSSPVCCRLDVVYINNASATMFPTWLSVPCREITHIDELYVQFRLFKCPDYMPKNKNQKIFYWGAVGEGLRATLYHLVVCILNEGPRGAGRITVGRLVMDFLPAEEGSDVLPLGEYQPDRPDLDFFDMFLPNREYIGNLRLPLDPGLCAAAKMMGFVQDSMTNKWSIREERERGGNNPQLAKIGNVEYRLAGTTQTLDDAAWFSR